MKQADWSLCRSQAHYESLGVPGNDDYDEGLGRVEVRRERE
jgi:hypothetical protein